MLTLLSLPSECLLSIIRHFEPTPPAYLYLDITPRAYLSKHEDLINLSTTCRRLHNLTSSSLLYLHALATALFPHHYPSALLARAAYDGDFDTVAKLMHRGCFRVTDGARFMFEPQKSALAAAVITGNRKMFDFLLEREVDWCRETVLKSFLCSEDHGDAALRVAAEGGKLEMVEYILEMSPDGVLRNGMIRSIVNAAVRGGNVEVLAKVLEGRNPGMVRPDGEDYYSPSRPRFMEQDDPFCWLDDKDVEKAEALVKLLISAGFNLNEKVLRGVIYRTPLMHHCHVNSSFELIKLLVTYGADPNISASATETANHYTYLSPFLCAAERGDYALSQFLLDNGAKPQHAGFPYLPCYAARKGDIKLYRYFVDTLHLPLPRETPPLEFPNFETVSKSSSPLSHAARHNHLDMVRMLLSEKHDVNAYDARGMTPLHYAKGESTVLLLSSGANPSVGCFLNKWTSFRPAVEKLDLVKVHALLSHPAFSDDISKSITWLMKGATAILQRMRYNGTTNDGVPSEKIEEDIVGIIQLLKKHGANVEVSDDIAWPLMLLVVHHNMLELMKELVDLGLGKLVWKEDEYWESSPACSARTREMSELLGRLDYSGRWK